MSWVAWVILLNLAPDKYKCASACVEWLWFNVIFCRFRALACTTLKRLLAVFVEYFCFRCYKKCENVPLTSWQQRIERHTELFSPATPHPLASPAMWHWGMCHIDFRQFNFFSTQSDSGSDFSFYAVASTVYSYCTVTITNSNCGRNHIGPKSQVSDSEAYRLSILRLFVYF